MSSSSRPTSHNGGAAEEPPSDIEYKELADSIESLRRRRQERADAGNQPRDGSQTNQELFSPVIVYAATTTVVPADGGSNVNSPNNNGSFQPITRAVPISDSTALHLGLHATEQPPYFLPRHSDDVERASQEETGSPPKTSPDSETPKKCPWRLVLGITAPIVATLVVATVVIVLVLSPTPPSPAPTAQLTNTPTSSPLIKAPRSPAPTPDPATASPTKLPDCSDLIQDSTELALAIQGASTNPRQPTEIELCPGIEIVLSNEIDISDKSFRISCPVGKDDGRRCTLSGGDQTRLFGGSPRNATFDSVSLINGAASIVNVSYGYAGSCKHCAHSHV